MLARFSVAYERFCRLLVAIFVVNVAILAHTLMGAVVLGVFPSFAAAQATFRAWVLSEDRSMRAKEVWTTFHGFWKSEVKSANLFGWPLIILWAVVIVDYYVMNWHARGDFDIMVSGVLLLIIVVLAVFSSLVWVVRANYAERPVWIVRTTLAMIVARPLCSLLQVGLLILTVLVWVQWSGILMVFGLSLPMFCTAWIVYSFGRLPGMDIHDRMEQSTGRARNQTSCPGSKKGGDKMVQSSVSQRVNRSKRLVSIKDIAKETGVSVCTVSLVMNNKDHNRVSKAVAQKIRATAENMGYKPNSVARTLRTSKSNTLGFVTDEIATTPYASKVLEGAQDAASKLGYILLTTNTNNDAELENQEISALLRYNVDGFLYAMMFHRKVDIPEVLEGSPTVVVDSEDAAGRVPSVYPDDELAGYDATNRLIQAGCRRIVYYGSATSIVAQEQRLTGYRRALAEAGIPFDDALVVEVSEFTNADDEAARVFDEIKPDGIFCFNDVRATFIYEAARERGVRIGADVSVISIDNQPFITNVIKPSLTTLELPHYEMGFEAVRQLVTILDGDKAVADLESDRGMAVQRQRDGSKTALRCRIIERDSIVS